MSTNIDYVLKNCFNRSAMSSIELKETPKGRPLQEIFDEILRRYNGVILFREMSSICPIVTISNLRDWKNKTFKFFVFSLLGNKNNESDYIIKCGINIMYKNCKINKTLVIGEGDKKASTMSTSGNITNEKKKNDSAYIKDTNDSENNSNGNKKDEYVANSDTDGITNERDNQLIPSADSITNESSSQIIPKKLLRSTVTEYHRVAWEDSCMNTMPEVNEISQIDINGAQDKKASAAINEVDENSQLCRFGEKDVTKSDTESARKQLNISNGQGDKLSSSNGQLPVANKTIFEVIGICKYKLAGFCGAGNECSFSHDLKNETIRNYFNEIGVDLYTEKERLVLVNNSLPSVCASYSLHKKCENIQTCTFLHICDKYIRGTCNLDNDTCALGHNFQEKSNQNILKSYKYENESSEKLCEITLVKDSITVDKTVPESNRQIENKYNGTTSQTSEKTSLDEEKTTNAYELFGHIAKKYACQVKISTLRQDKEFDIDQVVDVTKFFIAYKELFILFQLGPTEDDWIAQCRLINIFNSPSKMKGKIRIDKKLICENLQCSISNTCKYWLAGYCPEKESCLHAVEDNMMTGKLKDTTLTVDEMKQLVKCSFPEVCMNHNTSAGCVFNGNCTKLHICADFMREECFEENCKYSHDMKAKSCMQILKYFNLAGETLKQSYIKSIILVNGDGEPEDAKNAKIQAIISYVIDRCHGECYVNHLREFGQLAKTKSIKFLKQYFSGCMNILTLFALPSEPNNWIIKAKLQLHLPICINYLKSEGSCNGNCLAFHLCKLFVTFADKSPCIKYKKLCNHSHNVSDEHNSKVADKLNINFPAAALRLRHFIKYSLPAVCLFYNTTMGCSYPEYCTKLHVCARHVTAGCSNSSCQFDHDFYSKRNISLLRTLGFDSIPVEDLKLICITENFYNTTTESDTATDDLVINPQTSLETDLVHSTELCEEKIEDKNEMLVSRCVHPGLYDDDEHTEICVDYLLDNCANEPICLKNHVKNVTYLWQIKINNSWLAENLSAVNSKIEAAFCNKRKDTCTISVRKLPIFHSQFFFRNCKYCIILH